MNEAIQKYIKDELTKALSRQIWTTSPRPIVRILEDWHNQIDQPIVDDACRKFPELSRQEIVDNYCQSLTNLVDEGLKSKPEDEQAKIRNIIEQRCKLLRVE